MKVGIVGLGLIGGSLARDLASAGHTVIAYDRSRASLKAARRARVIAGVAGPGLKEFADCEGVVLAVPVVTALAILRRNKAALASVPLITDVGSTKASIVRAAERLGLGKRFVGAHPLAGDHESGWAASREGLFHGQRVYLTRTRESTAAAVHRARTLWTSVGGKVVMVEAAAHDELLAATSHLPQVSALALAMLLVDARVPRAELGRGGRDMTRLAASNPEVWAAILTDNRANVVPRMARLRKALRAIEREVAAGNAEGLTRLLTLCGRWAGR